MSKVKIISDDVRLDQLVYQYYGDLNNFDNVLAANLSITTAVIPKGTEVSLPALQSSDEEEVLW